MLQAKTVRFTLEEPSKSAIATTLKPEQPTLTVAEVPSPVELPRQTNITPRKDKPRLTFPSDEPVICPCWWWLRVCLASFITVYWLMKIVAYTRGD